MAGRVVWSSRVAGQPSGPWESTHEPTSCRAAKSGPLSGGRPAGSRGAGTRWGGIGSEQQPAALDRISDPASRSQRALSRDQRGARERGLVCVCLEDFDCVVRHVQIAPEELEPGLSGGLGGRVPREVGRDDRADHDHHEDTGDDEHFHGVTGPSCRPPYGRARPGPPRRRTSRAPHQETHVTDPCRRCSTEPRGRPRPGNQRRRKRLASSLGPRGRRKLLAWHGHAARNTGHLAVRRVGRAPAVVAAAGRVSRGLLTGPGPPDSGGQGEAEREERDAEHPDRHGLQARREAAESPGPGNHAWPSGGSWIDAQTASPQAPRSSSLTQPSMEGE